MMPPTGGHDRGYRAAAEERSSRVDGKDAVPFLGGDLVEGTPLETAPQCGVIYEDVDGPEFGVRSRDHRLDTRSGADVDVYGERPRH